MGALPRRNVVYADESLRSKYLNQSDRDRLRLGRTISADAPRSFYRVIRSCEVHTLQGSPRMNDAYAIGSLPFNTYRMGDQAEVLIWHGLGVAVGNVEEIREYTNVSMVVHHSPPSRLTRSLDTSAQNAPFRQQSTEIRPPGVYLSLIFDKLKPMEVPIWQCISRDPLPRHIWRTPFPTTMYRLLTKPPRSISWKRVRSEMGRWAQAKPRRRRRTTRARMTVTTQTTQQKIPTTSRERCTTVSLHTLFIAHRLM